MQIVVFFKTRLIYRTSDEKPWEEVKQYLDINKHLDQSTPSTSSPQSGLEVKVNEAINRGDIHTAEALSDKLAARDVS